MKKKLTFILLYLVIGICTAMAQYTKVTGTVTSADDGEPIIGASVMVKGTTIGTVTDIDGKFTLNVPQEGKILQISYVGMNSQEVAVKPVVNVFYKPIRRIWMKWLLPPWVSRVRKKRWVIRQQP